MKRIVYIGTKDQKGDNVAQTGLIWLRGEVKEVADDAKAKKLLEHPHVWADADGPYELVSLALVPTEPQVKLIPEDAATPFWEPIVIPVPAELFSKLTSKELIPVFMSPEDQESFAAWKKLDVETAPKAKTEKPAKAEKKAA